MPEVCTSTRLRHRFAMQTHKLFVLASSSQGFGECSHLTSFALLPSTSRRTRPRRRQRVRPRNHSGGPQSGKMQLAMRDSLDDPSKLLQDAHIVQLNAHNVQQDEDDVVRESADPSRPLSSWNRRSRTRHLRRFSPPPSSSPPSESSSPPSSTTSTPSSPPPLSSSSLAGGLDIDNAGSGEEAVIAGSDRTLPLTTTMHDALVALVDEPDVPGGVDDAPFVDLRNATLVGAGRAHAFPRRAAREGSFRHLPRRAQRRLNDI
ncbi:hypothetical protein BD626DRAFT_175771 [Schizophyllum amplum]|uniref:Uncharacterized protein n=1 Tax=Schizophyllum amplum TaxID=97359 RepID=A0A550C316_9AGAR|nr:hypothetical protein BD626DRAFT_175771 [Auriculariopsis ampla]